MLRTIWIAMLISGFALLMLSIILTFALKIPELADELSGRKAKRQIKRLKELNQGSGMENMGTEEVYSAMSSGSLLSTEMAKLESEGITEASPQNSIQQEEVPEESYVSTPEVKASVQDEDDLPTTSLSQDEDDIATGYVNSSNLEEGTTFMDEGEITGELAISTVNIQIIEEQSSIL